MFRTLLLVSGDNASAAPIPDQTAEPHVCSERPVEAGQELEEVDEFLVCSCRFSDMRESRVVTCGPSRQEMIS